MENEVSEIVEVKPSIPERIDGDGVCAAGIHGGIDAAAMMDRAKRTRNFRGRIDFRECIPCDRCGNCLEMRRFDKKGKDVILALYCLVGELEVTPYNTCNSARRTRDGRKKVVYYMENAPSGFRVEANRIKAELPYVSPGGGKYLESTMPTKGYVGGSGYYRRADGDSVKGADGKIPKGLMN